MSICLKNNSKFCQIFDLKRCFFRRGRPNKKKKNNKTNSDMRSVADLKIIIYTQVYTFAWHTCGSLFRSFGWAMAVVVSCCRRRQLHYTVVVVVVVVARGNRLAHGRVATATGRSSSSISCEHLSTVSTVWVNQCIPSSITHLYSTHTHTHTQTVNITYSIAVLYQVLNKQAPYQYWVNAQH